MNNLDITAEAFLPDVIARYPSTRAVFDRYGLHGCGGELGSRAASPSKSLPTSRLPPIE